MPLLTGDWVALAACVLFSVLLTLGVLSRHKWLNALCYILAIAVFAVHILDSIYDFVWVWLIPHPAVVIPMLAGVWGPLIAILIGLARYIKVRRDRRALYVICALLVGYAAYAVGRQLVDPGTGTETWWRQDTLMQSTNTTCVAAACCTWLRTAGFEVTERAAVSRGLISDNGGTQVQAWRILRLSLPAEYDVRIAPLTIGEMQRTGRWYVVSVRYSLAEGHCVVARAAGTDFVVIRDPLIGEYDKPVADFTKDWLGVGLWAERRDAGEVAPAG